MSSQCGKSSFKSLLKLYGKCTIQIMRSLDSVFGSNKMHAKTEDNIVEIVSHNKVKLFWPIAIFYNNPNSIKQNHSVLNYKHE